jgi:hypothetical protein
LSDVTFTCKGAEDELNGSTAESDPGYLSSISICGDVQLVILSQSWPKLKYFSFHKMLKDLVVRQRKVTRAMKIYVFEQIGWICFQYR